VGSRGGVEGATGRGDWGAQTGGRSVGVGSGGVFGVAWCGGRGDVWDVDAWCGEGTGGVHDCGGAGEEAGDEGPVRLDVVVLPRRRRRHRHRCPRQKVVVVVKKGRGKRRRRTD
jgi:hypothetical protein